MTTIIKNGTIATADLTYPADIAIEHGKITAIGPNLKGDTVLNARRQLGCVRPLIVLDEGMSA
jgi:dihydroorotase-like cyclic amidohydrolase